MVISRSTPNPAQPIAGVTGSAQLATMTAVPPIHNVQQILCIVVTETRDPVREQAYSGRQYGVSDILIATIIRPTRCNYLQNNRLGRIILI